MNFQRQILAATLVLAASTAFATQGFAQAATADALVPLKTGDEVLARYTEATGGADKYKAVKSLSQEASLSIPAAGIQGSISFKISGDDRFLTTAEIPSAGVKEASGILGDIGWADSPATGTRLVEGNELEQLKGGLNLQQYYDPKKVYDEVLLLDETEEVEGEECYVVRLTRPSGNISYEYFSIASGLKLKGKTTADTPNGEIDVESIYSEYKEFGGILHPTKLVQKLPNGLELEIQVKNIETNIEFPEGTFDLPENVKKLVEKKKEKAK